jgi:biotin operon repressor
MGISNEVLKTILKNLHKEEKISNKDRIFQQIKDSRENIGQLTKYRYSTVLKMRKENKKLSEIADELGVSKIRLTQIIRRMKDLGIEIPNSRDTGNPLDDKDLLERLNEIEAYLNEDMSINQISIIMKMSPHNISNLIYKHFIKT